MRSCASCAFTLIVIAYVLIALVVLASYFSYGTHINAGWVVYLVIAPLCGIVGIAAVSLESHAAFRAAGHSWGRWLLIELIGFITFTGPFTWLCYHIFIRPSVVADDGFKSSPVPSYRSEFPRRKSDTDALWAPKREVRCGRCNNGKEICYNCGTRGTVKDSSTSLIITCPACHNNPANCKTCNGRGVVPA